MGTYFIYDGRANSCPLEECSVIEVFSAPSRKTAERYLKREWAGYDYVVANDRGDVIYSLLWEEH